MTGTSQRQARPLRLSRVGALVVLVFLGGGILYLVIRNGPEPPAEVEALVPVREIRPYQVITPQDLGVRTVRREAGREFPRDRARVENRYALTTLPSDRPFTAESIGPPAPPGLTAAQVLTVEGGASVSLAGQLGRGDHVDVLVPGRVSRIEGAFVLDLRALSGDRWAVTLAVARPLSDDQAAMLAEGRVNLVRRPGP